VAFKDIVDIRKSNEGVFEPTASLKEFQDFKETNVYRDLIREWDEYLIEVRDMLENPSLNLDNRGLDRLGGNAEALRHMMNTVDQFIGQLTDVNETNETNEEGGRNDNRE